MAARIANLRPGDGEEPLEIRVSRKWISYGKRGECCYIFIDQNGDAIQAVATLSDRSYFDSLFKVGSCYRLTNYICESGKTFMITVPHNTCIRLGRAAKFQEIPHDGFPIYYFRFLNYAQLSHRLDNNGILTDYIGKLENVTDVIRRKGVTFRKLKIENTSGTMIDATIWDDDAISFNKEAVAALPSPIIVDVTSMKVTQFQGVLQLNATPGSYVYVNPEIEESAIMAAEFVTRDEANSVLKIDYEKSENKDIEKHRNRFTLAELLSQNPFRYMGVQFTCRAAATDFDATRGWYYKACNQCRKKLQPVGKTSVCGDHGPVAEPKHLYFLATNMADQTAEAKSIFFDDAATALIGHGCKKMIDELGYIDPNTLPPPISIKTGMTKIFQMRFSRSSTLGNIDFVVDNIFEDMPTEEIAPTYIPSLEEMAQPLPSMPATPNSVATPTLQLTSTPPTPTLATTPDLATPAPPTPSLPPVTKRPRQSYAKRTLLKALDQSDELKKQKQSVDVPGEDIEKVN